MSTSTQEETVVDLLGEDHPARASTRAVLDSIQVLIGMRELETLEQMREAAADVERLLTEVPAEIAMLFQLTEQLQDDLRGLRDEGLAMAQELNQATALRESIAPIVRDIRRLTFARSQSVETELRCLDGISAELAQRPTLESLRARASGGR